MRGLGGGGGAFGRRAVTCGVMAVTMCMRSQRRDEHFRSVGVLAFAFFFFFSKTGEILRKSLKIVACDIRGGESFWPRNLVFSVLAEGSSNLKSAVRARRCSAPVAVGCRPRRALSDSQKCVPGVLSEAWLGCCSDCNRSLEKPPFV